jgi:hypothetical protein
VRSEAQLHGASRVGSDEALRCHRERVRRGRRRAATSVASAAGNNISSAR